MQTRYFMHYGILVYHAMCDANGIALRHIIKSKSREMMFAPIFGPSAQIWYDMGYLRVLTHM
jgi:hypothetical protein